MQLQGVNFCYLCDKPLDSNSTQDQDHVIPDHLFKIGDPERPQLSVHHKCNNLKSKEDEWFVKHLQIWSSFNPDAEREFSKMMDKAINEKSDAYIIGKKLHNYKLARGMFDGVMWGMELKHNEQSFIQMKIPKKDNERFSTYIKTMCRGLFIKNIPGSQPSEPEIIVQQYADLELKNKENAFIEPVKNLIESGKGNNFGQRWGNWISYIGSRVKETPDKGYLFVQFYSQVGILAFFK